MTKNRKDLTPRRISRIAVRPKPQSTANIRVVIRVRPPNSNEHGDNQRMVVKCHESNLLTFDPEEESTPFFYHGVQQKRRDLLKKQQKNLQFAFDRVFPEVSTNEEIFVHSTKDLIDTLMDGCNCSVFAYGATGAGKTFTMLGKPNAPGITVLTMRELFTRIGDLSVDRDFELFVTYLEVYNENVRDLLKPGELSLQLREDAQVGVRVARLTHKKILNSEELFDLLEHGNKNRTQHPTDANAESSRSHAVFQVYIKMTVKTTGQTIMAKLSMIDLAGSERGAATGCKGLRFTEGANINKSLLALGNCINSLADGHRHVPYRDSKLTRILKDSLGGNCHTVMIANVSPSSLSFEDTYNTLKYANRAKKIKANVKKNVVANQKCASEYIKVIEELTEEIRRLKEENQQLALKSKDREETATVPVPATPAETGETNETTFVTVSSSISVAEADSGLMDEVTKLFNSYRLLEERRHQMAKKKYLLEMRIDLKDEANNRLSGFAADTPDKENGHKRLTQTMDRLRRQAVPYECEVKDLEAKLFAAKNSIDKFVEENPEVKEAAENEQNKIDRLKALNDKEMIDAMYKMQCSELRARGELLEKMSGMVRPWFLLLKSRSLVTEEMTTSFQNLRAHLLGHCNVSWEDGGDSGLSTTSSSTSSSTCSSNTEMKDEIRSSSKRKLNGGADDMELTFVCTEPRPKTTESGGLFKDYQPSPPKRQAKCVRSSPRILKKQKENKQKEISNTGRRPVGTMGTSSRFTPGCTKSVNQQSIKRPFR